MPLILTAGPAVEPVSLDETKEHLRIDRPHEDTLIASLILAARLYVERVLDLALITQNWSLFLDEWPDTRGVALPLNPVQAVSAVKTYDGSDQSQIASAEGYFLDRASRPARLLRRNGSVWPVPRRDANGIEIAFTAGFGETGDAVPAPLRQAILLLVAHWYEVREPVLVDQNRLEAPLTVAALMEPYRQARLA